MLASEGLMEEFVGRYDVRYMLVKPAQFQAMQRWPSWTARSAICAGNGSTRAKRPCSMA